MNKIILQPTSNRIAHKHYVNTILNPIFLRDIKDYVDSEVYSQLLVQYPSGKASVWGVTNGKNNINKKKWEKISRGDITLFSRKGGIFASAVTTIKLHDEKLAKLLWGVDKEGNTWENIYFVEEIKNINIPYPILNAALGYKDNYIIQGFNILEKERGENLGIKYDLFSREIFEDISEQEYTDFVVKLNDEMELTVEGLAYRRREQSFLRNYLFSGKSSCACGICGKDLPVNMLVTSHIKKRCECSKQEKLDYKHIVMPMCKFGCDDLYEKGYIYVEDGRIKINNRKWMTEDLKLTLSELENRECIYYNENTKAYFEAHKQKFGI